MSPLETEDTHFIHILEPLASKYAMNCPEFTKAYNKYDGTINELELDEHFLHDRAVRESGHDASYRLENVAAKLSTIDLNSLLYKYETNVARTIEIPFGGRLAIPHELCVGVQGITPNQVQTSTVWDRKAKNRRKAVNRYLWNEDSGIYFDYDTDTQCLAVCFWDRLRIQEMRGALRSMAAQLILFCLSVYYSCLKKL